MLSRWHCATIRLDRVTPMTQQLIAQFRASGWRASPLHAEKPNPRMLKLRPQAPAPCLQSQILQGIMRSIQSRRNQGAKLTIAAAATLITTPRKTVHRQADMAGIVATAGLLNVSRCQARARYPLIIGNINTTGLRRNMWRSSSHRSPVSQAPFWIGLGQKAAGSRF